MAGLRKKEGQAAGDVAAAPDEDAWAAAMRRGDEAAAWAISDRVLAARDAATRDDPRLPYHRRWVWDGRPFRGREVLVRCYHGLGDTLQFARFLPALRAVAGRVALEVQPELHGLLGGAADRVVPFDVAAPLSPAECDIEIMELGHALRLPAAAVAPPYVTVGRTALPTGTIGLCCTAGGWDAARSVPAGLLRDLASGPCVWLQPGAAPFPVLNQAGSPVRLEETASLIAGTALVVTVDTMVAHLAGAMNHPACLLLKHEADWRWMQDRCDSPWYPSLRLYRQDAPGEWDAAVTRLLADLVTVRQGC